MNKIILMGRLTRDPEIRYSQSESPLQIARFSIAVNRIKKNDGNTVDFFNIVAFGRLASFSEKYLKKGIKILLTGRVGTGSYEKNGVRTPFFEVCADDIEFAESKNAVNHNFESNTSSEADDSDFILIPEELENELPF